MKPEVLMEYAKRFRHQVGTQLTALKRTLRADEVVLMVNKAGASAAKYGDAETLMMTKNPSRRKRLEGIRFLVRDISRALPTDFMVEVGHGNAIFSLRKGLRV